MRNLAGRRARFVAALVFSSPIVGSAVTIPEQRPPRAAPPAPVEIRQAWRVTLPLRTIDRVTAYHLLDGIIYAVVSNGSVHAVQADTGRILWSRALVKPPGVVYPPFIHYSPEFYGVGFTLAHEVVLLDPQTGSEYKRMLLEKPAVASAASMADTIFSAEADRHCAAYQLKDLYQRWHIVTTGPITVPPIFLNDLQTVFLTDASGDYAMLWASDREVVYHHRLGGAATGPVALDNQYFYIATSDNLLNCIDKLTGAVRWQFRLPTRPQGGPILVNGNIYQALSGGGIQRIGKEPGRPNWLHADGTRFLSEWNGRVALLDKVGRISVVDSVTGEFVGSVPTDGLTDGIPNPVNSALLLTSAAGEMRCLQPPGSDAASLARFRPPTTQPTTRPSDPPALVRPVKE
ncbi:MAG: PQQ-binding-like beta-propeller repeat protein, partial [Phycisphaerae bacterium]